MHTRINSGRNKGDYHDTVRGDNFGLLTPEEGAADPVFNQEVWDQAVELTQGV